MPSYQVFGVFALEVNDILQATPPTLRTENEDVRHRGVYNVPTYNSIIPVLIRVLESRVASFQVQHTWWYLVPGTRYIKAQHRLQDQRYGGLFRAEKLLMSRDQLITGANKQSNAFLMRRRRRSAVSPWNEDPLRSL